MATAADMTASFRLTLREDLSAGFDKLFAKLNRFRELIDRLGGRNVFGGVNEGINQADSGFGRLNERLDGTTNAAQRTGARLRGIGADARVGAEEGVAALDSLQAKLQAISAADIRRAVLVAASPSSDINDRPPPGGVRGYAGRVGGGLHGFSQATQTGIGEAFGAAAAGFGLIEPVRAAAEFDNTIRHIAITLGMSGKAGDEFVARFGRQMDQLARATGQTGEKMAEAAGFFSRENYSLDKINAVMPTIGKVSTAYNADPLAVAHTTFALQENLGISDKDLGGALSSIALAGKKADLPLEKLASLFPAVAAQAGSLGVKGRSGVNDLAAMLAVIRKSTGTESEATTDIRSFMQQIISPHTAKRFERYGVDLYKGITAAKARGADPVDAVLRVVDTITNHGNDLKALGTLFNNEQDRGFASALLKHLDQYTQIRDTVSKANPKMLDDDFAEGMKSLRIQVQAFGEALEQLERRVGTRFAPIMAGMTRGLHGIIDAFDWLDVHLPGATTVIIGTLGGLLALVAVFGALGAVALPLKAGFGLLRVVLSPLGSAFMWIARGAVVLGEVLAGLVASIGLVPIAIGALVIAVIAAAVEVYRHWDAVKRLFAGLVHTIAGVWNTAWDGAKPAFLGFEAWALAWAKALPGKIAAELSSLGADIEAKLGDAANTAWHHLTGNAAATAAVPAKVEVSGGVHVTTSPGAGAKVTTGRNSAVPLMPARARGPMTARP